MGCKLWGDDDYFAREEWGEDSRGGRAGDGNGGKAGKRDEAGHELRVDGERQALTLHSKMAD